MKITFTIVILKTVASRPMDQVLSQAEVIENPTNNISQTTQVLPVNNISVNQELVDPINDYILLDNNSVHVLDENVNSDMQSDEGSNVLDSKMDDITSVFDEISMLSSSPPTDFDELIDLLGENRLEKDAMDLSNHSSFSADSDISVESTTTPTYNSKNTNASRIQQTSTGT